MEKYKALTDRGCLEPQKPFSGVMGWESARRMQDLDSKIEKSRVAFQGKK
jgi:hypothetical protein